MYNTSSNQLIPALEYPISATHLYHPSWIRGSHLLSYHSENCQWTHPDIKPAAMPQHTKSHDEPPYKNRPVSDSDIAVLLGRGLSYDDWEQQLLAKGCMWNEGLKNMIIGKEYEMFRDEIMFLRSEPGISQGANGRKSNSLTTILKRLQGEEWFRERPAEKLQRSQNFRLFGKDAKPRCFQKHVEKWINVARMETSNNGSSRSPPDSLSPQTRTLSPTAIPRTPYQLVPDAEPGPFGSSLLPSPNTADVAGYLHYQYDLDSYFGTEAAIPFTSPITPARSETTSTSPHLSPGQNIPCQTIGATDVNQCFSESRFYLTDGWPENILPMIDQEPSFGNLGPLTALSLPETKSIPTSQIICAVKDSVDDASRRSITTSLTSNGIEGEFGTTQSSGQEQDIIGYQHSCQISLTSDISMPDCAASLFSLDNVGREDLHPPLLLLKQASTFQSNHESKKRRNRTIISLRRALSENQTKLRMVQEELERARLETLTERKAKDIAVAESIGLREQVAQLAKISARQSELATQEYGILDESLRQHNSDNIAHETGPRSKPSPQRDSIHTHRRRFTSIKVPLPLRIAMTVGSNPTSRGTSSHGSSENITGLVAPSSPSHARSGSFANGSQGESEAPTSTNTHMPFQHIKRKLNSMFKPHRADDGIPPPPLSPVRWQWQPVHDDVKKRLTMDSGYASLRYGDTPRTSLACTDCEQVEDEAI